MARRKSFNKEEDSENWCFECKDGGRVRICDYKTCVKVYHPNCVGKGESFMEAKTKWNCNWHFCHVCRKASNFYCFCCPYAVCKKCLYDFQFAVVRRNKGLCNSCLELAWLIETNKDVYSNGCKFDVNDPETTEFYFEGYWRIIKRKERLTSENVISAYDLLKKVEMHKHASSAFESDEEELNLPLSWSRKRKRSKGKVSGRKEKPNAKEQVSLQNRIVKAAEIQGNRGFSLCVDSPPPLQMLLEQLPLLHEVPGVIADTQEQQQMASDKTQLLHKIPVIFADVQDVEPACKDWTRTNEEEDDDGLPESSPGRTSKGNETSCHMPSEQLQYEAPVVPLVIANAQDAKSEMICHMNYSPDVVGSSSQPSVAVSKSHHEAVPMIIIDVKDEMTKDINPLREQLDFFAKLQSLLNEAVEDLPGSSQQPQHTPEQMEALECLRKCCSMSFVQLMNHDLKDCFLPSVNSLMTSGYFPKNMLGMVASLQLNFLRNTSIHSCCLEDVRKADEEQERATSLRIKLADKKICFDQIEQNIQVKHDKIEDLKRQLAEERKFVASLRDEARLMYEYSKTCSEALSQSIQSARTLEKRKGSSQQLMREIDDSWTKFQIEISKHLKGFSSF